MIQKIINEIEESLDIAYQKMYEKDKLSFVLLVGRADIIPGLKHQCHTDCVIDFQQDRYYDETRERFYLRYLNRNYKKEGFNYGGDEGIDDLSIEMMIYDHLWDSFYFLKSLVRMASILSGKGYEWKPSIPANGKWKYIHNAIIEPFKENNIALGEIVEKGYSSAIRYSFAHSLFNINVDDRTITLRPKSGIQIITFEEFQKKFLYSVILMNKMQNAMEKSHDFLCSLDSFVTESFFTPDGIKVRVKATIVGNESHSFPEFRMYRIEV